MGDSFAGTSSRRKLSFTRSILAKEHSDLQRSKPLGLHCDETWELSDSEEHSEGSQVCSEGQELHSSPDRPGHMDKISSDEERSILRASSKIDAGRDKYRRYRRSSSRYGRQELSQAAQVRTLSDLEEEEDRFKRAYQMDPFTHSKPRPGFSYPGDLVQQQSAWLPKTFQTETVMAMGEYQPWEDFICDETQEILSDIYDSDGCTSS